jgi:uncharacterized membrane protein SpoIIM required for sporulation
MKEIVFYKKNVERWKTLERNINSKRNIDPDLFYEYYIQLNDDLAFAKTNYSNSEITDYLNNLTLSIHQKIYKNKKVDYKKIFDFWQTDYPALIHKYKRHFWYAFTIFMLSVIIGAFSASKDSEFVRLILGDNYVNQTLENINNGDPMAIYKKANETTMFLGITINNIKVAFIAFVFGIFLSIGTGYILLKNGIMLGSFQYFFFEHNLLRESALTIWIHGTLEIFAIIMASASGLIIGNSILFPGTYSRIDSFKRGATDGIKIVSGLVPMFIVAGFLEGFITRHTEFPDFLRLTIIVLSLCFIVWYFFIYPNKIVKLKTNNQLKQ